MFNFSKSAPCLFTSETFVKSDMLYKPRTTASRFESHSRRYIRGFIHNIFIYCEQILPERSYYMSEQNSNNQVSINKTNKFLYGSGIKKTTFTSTINETDVEGLKRKINSITQYQKPYISKVFLKFFLKILKMLKFCVII